MQTQSFNIETCYTEDELNDWLVIAANSYLRRLEQSGLQRSAILFDSMIDNLRDGDNKEILRMFNCYPAFAQYFAKNYDDLLTEITDKCGEIARPLN